MRGPCVFHVSLQGAGQMAGLCGLGEVERSKVSGNIREGPGTIPRPQRPLLSGCLSALSDPGSNDNQQEEKALAVRIPNVTCD